MRKIISIILLACISMSFSGCGFAVAELLLESTEKKPEPIHQVEINEKDSSDSFYDNSSEEMSETSEFFESFCVEEISDVAESVDVSEDGFNLNEYVIATMSYDALDVCVVRDDAYDAFPDEINKYYFTDWYNITVVFRARENIKNFRLLGYNDAIRLCVEKTLQIKPVLAKGEMYIARLCINDFSANVGFSYETSSSDINYYYFGWDATGTQAVPYILNSYTPDMLATYGLILENCGDKELYAFYDMDLDGVVELVVKRGTCEADYTYEFYDYLNGIPEYLGHVSASHSALVTDGTNLVIHSAQMGYEHADKVIISNGMVETWPILDRAVDLETDDYTEFESITIYSQYDEYPL